MLPRILKNFNLFVDGNSYIGKADEVVLPKLALKTEEYRAGGLDTPVEIEMGTEKLNMEFSLSEFNPDTLSLWGLTTGGLKTVSLRGSLENEFTIDRLNVQGYGRVKEIDSGTLKAHERSTIKFVMSLLYYKLSVGSKNIIEVDVINMRRVINGFDQILLRRLNLGL